MERPWDSHVWEPKSAGYDACVCTRCGLEATNTQIARNRYSQVLPWCIEEDAVPHS